MIGDLVGRLRGLVGQRFHFGGDHGEAAAGIAGARRLDGGVERQQVGLLGVSLTTSPICCAACESLPIRASVCSAWRTALSAILLDSLTRRPISLTEAESSSVETS